MTIQEIDTDILKAKLKSYREQQELGADAKIEKKINYVKMELRKRGEEGGVSAIIDELAYKSIEIKQLLKENKKLKKEVEMYETAIKDVTLRIDEIGKKFLKQRLENEANAMEIERLKQDKLQLQGSIDMHDALVFNDLDYHLKPTVESISLFETMNEAKNIEAEYKSLKKTGNAVTNALSKLSKKSKKRAEDVASIANMSKLLTGENLSVNDRVDLTETLSEIADDIFELPEVNALTEDDKYNRANILNTAKGMIFYGGIRFIKEGIEKEHNVVNSRFGKVADKFLSALKVDIGVLGGADIVKHQGFDASTRAAYLQFSSKVEPVSRYKLLKNRK